MPYFENKMNNAWYYEKKKSHTMSRIKLKYFEGKLMLQEKSHNILRMES